MRLTIIVDDNAVYKNGLCYPDLNWDGTPENVRALQWFTSRGWLEYNNGTANEPIDSLPVWAANAVAAWDKKQYEIDNPPPPDPETPEQTVARLEQALDAYIDSQAQGYRYESIRTMVTYENDPNPKFDAEGKGAKAFRSACYTLAIEILGEVQQGSRPIPTEAELIALMPLLASFIVYA